MYTLDDISKVFLMLPMHALSHGRCCARMSNVYWTWATADRTQVRVLRSLSILRAYCGTEATVHMIERTWACERKEGWLPSTDPSRLSVNAKVRNKSSQLSEKRDCALTMEFFSQNWIQCLWKVVDWQPLRLKFFLQRCRAKLSQPTVVVMCSNL